MVITHYYIKKRQKRINSTDFCIFVSYNNDVFRKRFWDLRGEAV